MITYNDRFPPLDAAARKRLAERFMACAPAVAKKIGVSEHAVRNARMLGCGYYGCTYLVEGLPRDRAVLKVTTDNMEGNAAQQIVEDGTARHEAGLPKISSVFRLGQCSVLPGMRPFVFTPPRFGPSRMKTYYKGPGAPYRPVWVIQREELDDAEPHLRARGLKKAAIDKAIDVIWRYGSDLSSVQTSFGRRRTGIRRPTPDELDTAMVVLKAEALINAIDWLAERDMAWLDMRKLANLGWREGSGLVIRDIGFTESGGDYLEDIETIGDRPPIRLDDAVGRSNGRSSLAASAGSRFRAMMNEAPRDLHYVLTDERGYVYCEDGDFHLPSLVGSDAGGLRPKRWKTEKGAMAAGEKLPQIVRVRFMDRSDRY